MHSIKQLRIVVLFASLLICIAHTNAAVEEWKIAGPMSTNRIFPSVANLGPNFLLVAGGYAGSLYTSGTADCELYSVSGGNAILKKIAPMKTRRVEFPLLSWSGTMAIAIGGYSNGSTTTVIEAYDIQTDTWRVIGNMTRGRRQHVAYRASDSTIVIVGGRDDATTTMPYAEIFNINTGVSRAIANFPLSINGGIANVMSDGTGIICGGRDGGPNSRRYDDIYTYNLRTEKWVTVGKLPSGREAAMSYKLTDGRLVIIGGSIGEDPAKFVPDVLLEDGGLITLKGYIGDGIVYGGVAEHGEGRIIVVGGWLSNGQATNNCYYYDVEKGSVTKAPTLKNFRRYVKSGTVKDLVTGKPGTFAIGGVGPVFADFSVEVLTSGCDASANNKIDFDKAYVAGTAKRIASGILLTDTTNYSAGAAWANGKVNVASGIDVKFSFRMTKGNDGAQPDNGPKGADGVALVFQSLYQNSVGLPGRGLGYEGVSSGLAIEFDAYINAEYSDVAASHIAVQKGDGQILRPVHQAPYLLGMVNTGVPPFVSDGRTYHARVVLEGSRVKVYCDTTGVLNVPILTVENVDIMSILGNPKDGASYMGITSATGISVQRHEILSWEVSGCNALVSDVFEDLTPGMTGYTVYPSPASEQATLSLPPNLEEPTVVSIFSANGEMVYSTVAPAFAREVTLRTTEFISGVYVVVCRTGTQTNTVKWLVQH